MINSFIPKRDKKETVKTVASTPSKNTFVPFRRVEPESDKPQTFHLSDDKLPFGALGVNKDGNPYYGEGFHGWVRKTYGDLFDPAKRLRNPDEEDFNKYKEYIGGISNTLDNINWGDWGAKVFGLSSQEAATAIGSISAASSIDKANRQELVDSGEATQTEATIGHAWEGISQNVNMVKDFAQDVLWGGLSIIGVTDTGVRKLMAMRLGIDELADKYGKRDEQRHFFSNVPGDNVVGRAARDVGAFADVISENFDILGIGKDVLTLAKSGVSFKDVKEASYKYRRGASGIYSLAYDEARRREFTNRVSLGEDAGLVAAELAAPGIEFSGSLLGDPSTYLGLSIVKPKLVSSPVKLFGKEMTFLGNVPHLGWEKIGKIPTFGELVPILGVGNVKYETQAAASFFEPADNSFMTNVKAAFDSDNAVEAKNLLDTAANKSLGILYDVKSPDKAVKKAAMKKMYAFTSYTQSGKVKLLGRDVGLFTSMVLSGAKNNIDEALETLQDLRMMRSSPVVEEQVNAAKRLMMKNRVLEDGTVVGHGNMFFSTTAYRTAEILDYISPQKLDEIFAKNIDAPEMLQDELYKTLGNAFHEIMPSVDEMADAKFALRSGELKKALQEASDNFVKISTHTTDKLELKRARDEIEYAQKALDKAADYAERYDDLPNHVKTISKIHRQTSKVVGASTGMQVELFMKWSAGFFSRNIWGQGAGIAFDMGLKRSLETSVSGWWKPMVEMLTGGKVDPVTAHVMARMKQVQDATGIVPHTMLEAIGMGGAEVKTPKAFLRAAKNSEQMASADIVANEIFDVIQGALPAVLSGDGSLDQFVKAGQMTDKQAVILDSLIRNNNGNTGKAIEQFRKMFSPEGLESWRNIPFPKEMTGILRQSGNLEEVLRLQREAVNATEFENEVTKIFNKMNETVQENAANEVSTLSSGAQSQMGDVVGNVQENFNNGLASEQDADYITRLSQGWWNVETQLDEMNGEIRDELVLMSDRNGVKTTDFTKRLSAVRADAKSKHNIKEAINTARWKAVYGVNGFNTETGQVVKKITVREAWEQLEVMDTFNLKELMPSPPASEKQFIAQLHTITDDFISGFWRDRGITMHNDSLNVYKDWAAANRITIDELASTHNTPRDPFRLLEVAYQKAIQIEDLRPQRTVKSAPFKGATLDDMIFMEGQSDFAGKKFNKQYVRNAVNVERKAQGKTKAQTFKEIPWDEAMAVMKARMGRFYTPGDIVKGVNADLAKREKAAGKVAEKVTEETNIKDMPEYVREYFQRTAKRLLDELHGGGVEKAASVKQNEMFERMQGRHSTNINWWKESYEKGWNRKAIDAALEKAASGGKGKDTANVNRVKELILQRIRYGDKSQGIPPDLHLMEQMGADKKALQDALEDFNEITKNNFSLQEAIDASTPSDELMRASTDMPFYNDKGQLIQPKRYGRIQDIPDELVKSFVDMKKVPPPMNEEFITHARALSENMPGFMADGKRWIEDVKSNWGRLDDAGDLSDDLENVLSKWKGTVDDRMQHVKDKAIIFAQYKRDALLHDYNKTYADVALAYLMPFSYWHTRTYMRWAERVVDNPKIASNYLAYKRNMERAHADMPEWWRQNVGINLPGVNPDNPIYMNLEATINPLNGLTGVDFNDPYKRVDAISRTVDDLGKMGPAFAAPLNWAVALWLYKKGEDEAAKRWMGRLFPQSVQVKSLLTKAGADINLGPLVKHNEVDPFVNMTSDGLDPYELNRVNRMLSQIVENEKDPEMQQLLATQAVDAARTHEGPMWDEARKMASSDRFAGNMSSFILGVGFKPRTQEDMKIDQFYGEYFQLLRLRDTMTSQEYRESWDQLRDAYPFADALIIGKKSDEERDGAFAYNVLGRVPPGQMNSVLGSVGLTGEDLNRFYESKGDFSDWTEGDQKRFMAGVVDLSAVLQMPALATRQEWTSVKDGYQGMKAEIQDAIGDEDIWDKVDQYYALKNESRYQGNAYLDSHPEVSDALDLQTQFITNNQDLFKYYGSMNTLNSYYNGEVRKEMEGKYGKNIYNLYYVYLDIPDDKQKKMFMKANPQLKPFIKEKNKSKDAVNQAVVQMALKLPSQPEVAYRSDLNAPTATQAAIASSLNLQTDVDPQVLWANASEPLQELVTMYWQNGDKLPNAAVSNLDYLGEQFGISGQQALQLMGVMISQ